MKYSELRTNHSELFFKEYAIRSIQKKDKLPSNIDDRPMQPAMLLLHAGGGNPTHSS
jgi:hypothetical protein